MSQCRACERRSPTDHEESGLTSVLMLRGWREGDGIRCRFVRVTGSGAPDLLPGAAQGEDDVVAAIRVWLNTL